MYALTLNWHAPILPGAGWKPLSPDFPVSRILTLLTVVRRQNMLDKLNVEIRES